MGIEKRPGICKECGTATAWHVAQEDCTLCGLRKAVAERDEILSLILDFARFRDAVLEDAIKALILAEQVAVPAARS